MMLNLYGLGLARLFDVSVPTAAWDSSAREYAPTCTTGTREQYIQDLTSWASNFITRQDRRFRMMWMSGPAGVGKSTIAQTFAEKMRGDNLGATFFFSRPDQIVKPEYFFPSIAHQISTKIELFADILDQKIRKDPSLLSKALEVQFQELVVAPLLELEKRNVAVQDRLVIVDGLDECSKDNAQCTIVQAIAAAIRKHGDKLPLLWAFFSRPEPHIVSKFTSSDISPLCLSITLPISRDTDGDIRLYLRDGLESIRKRSHNIILPFDPPWPSENDITALVNRSAGLFVQAATLVKLIGDPDVLDPEEQLKEALSHRSTNSPMGDLDALYALIMRQIPRNILPFTLMVLLLFYEQPPAWLSWSRVVPIVANLVGLNFHSFTNALSKLHSVLKFDFDPPPPFFDAEPRQPTMVPWTVHFYHVSFMEFLSDPKRCGEEFWIHNPQLYTLLAKRNMDFLSRVFQAHERSPGKSDL